MGLNEVGCVVHRCWAEIPAHAPHARLGAFVVMPNHVHALIELLPMASGETDLSLATVVGSFKSAVTRKARRENPAFGWQRRFHDQIVRSDRALQRIWTYIENNPRRWHANTFHVTP